MMSWFVLSFPFPGQVATRFPMLLVATRRPHEQLAPLVVFLLLGQLNGMVGKTNLGPSHLQLKKLPD